MLYRDPYEPSTELDYEPGGGNLLAHVDVRSGYDADNLGYSVFRALVSVASNPSTLRKWKVSATSVPGQDADRRVLRGILEEQSQLLGGIANHVPGTYPIFSNWRLLPRRGYQRLELWV
jgi:hypothetical protein